MSDRDDWRWEYDPNAEHVVAGLPAHVVAEVERLAGEMVALAEVGVDITDLGEGPRSGVPGGVRRIPLLADGWFYALPLPHLAPHRHHAGNFPVHQSLVPRQSER